MPELPPELYRYIFILASNSAKKADTLKFCLVARCVHEWLKPSLFDTIIVDSEDIAVRRFKMFKQQSLEFTRSAIKYICIYRNCSNVFTTFLNENCTGARFLSIIGGSYPYKELSSLRPTQITFCFPNIYDLPSACDNLFSLPLFDNVTHLEILWISFRYQPFNLPQLTHFAFFPPMYLKNGYEDFERWVQNGLRGCQNIEVLILLDDKGFDFKIDKTIETLVRFLSENLLKRAYVAEKRRWDSWDRQRSWVGGDWKRGVPLKSFRLEIHSCSG